MRQAANAIAPRFIVLLTLIMTLSWGLGTESGAKWLMRQVRAWVPGLSVARVEGVFFDRLVLQGLDYGDKTERIRLDRLELRIDASALWRGALHIRSLQILKLQYASTDDSPIVWPNLKLPFDLIIDELKVRDGVVKMANDDRPTRLDSLDAALDLTRDGLECRRFAWVMPDLTAEISGRMAMGGMQKVGLKTTWNWHPKGRPEFQGEGFAGGNLDRVTLRQTLKFPLAAELSAVIMQPLDHPQWTAQLDVPEFPVNRIDPAWPAWPVTLSLHGEGTDRVAEIGGSFLGKLPGVGQPEGQLQLSYTEPGDLLVETLELTLPETKTRLEVSGTAKHLDRTPELNGVAQWTNLSWPLDRKPEWQSQRGQLSLTGIPGGVRFDAKGLLKDSRVTASGQIGLPPGRMEFRGIRAQGAGLNLQLDGIFGPQLDLTWTLQGDQLGTWLPGARGQITSRGHVQGPRDGPAGTMELMARDLQFRDDKAQELVLNLKGGLTPGAPPIEAAVLARGVRYQGNAADQLKLDFRGGLVLREGRLEPSTPTAELNLVGHGLSYQQHAIREVTLAAKGGLMPGSPPVEGDLKLLGFKSGDIEAGELKLAYKGGLVYRNQAFALQGMPMEAELLAERLVQANRQARELRVGFKAGESPDSPLKVTVKAPEIRLGEARLNLDLDAQGSRARRTLSATVAGHWVAPEGAHRLPVRLSLRAEGGWSAAQWAGTVSQFDWDLDRLGHWPLSRPLALRIQRSSGELGLACWASRGAEACLQGQLNELGSWQTAARVSEFELDRLQRWLPDSLGLKGVLSADWQFSGQGDRVQDGRCELQVDAAQIELMGGASPFKFRPAPLSLGGRVGVHGGDLRLVAEQPGFGSLRADLTVEGPLILSRLGQTPLSGEARLELQNIDVLLPLTTDIEKLQGRLDAGVRFSGTPNSPKLQVHSRLFDAGFGVPRLGIKVRSLHADAISRQDNQLVFSGRGVSGNGEIKLDGTVSLSPKDNWPLKLSLFGNRFLIADTPEAKVYLSPDLLVERKDARLSLSGRIKIPEATIQIPNESGALKPSRDVVIVQGDEPPEPRENPLETRVEVVLGDKISVSGPGYQARVDGQVTVEQLPGTDALGTGEILIHNGKYSMYGVDLETDGGRLVFNRSPMENPNLDIQAVRKSDDVVAGAKMLGTLNKPNITLFSDRPMSQTEILSYLVVGQSFNAQSPQDGTAMRGAASALGGSAGGLLAKELSSRLGLGGLVDISMQGSLGAGGIAQAYTGSGPWGGVQGTALFLGRYLTPKMYVQYGMGLFQNAYVFRLRYDLTQRWKVQTETGEYSGGDILYQWED
jgi:translocation and assembly module TamB